MKNRAKAALQVLNRYCLAGCLLGLLLGATMAVSANGPGASDKISLNLRDVDIAEVMEMLSRKEKVNILLSEGVEGEVSVSLYGVTLNHAIYAIAEAAGFAVERRSGTYFIVKHENVNQYAPAGLTDIRTYKVQYTAPDVAAQIIENHISKYGKVTTLDDRKLIVVEDTPEFLRRIERLLEQVDTRPKQILIEAKILEVNLLETESFGLDWVRLFSYDSGDGNFGVRRLSNPTSPGLFFQLLTPNVEVFLDSLETSGRMRTLATPKLLALEDQEAETIIGDRLGYQVTTTINQVTTESIKFLESGIILKVKPSVDRQGRILLDIHPEVSTGTITDDGIPNQTTTEVTTHMLVRDGQTVFIGGLMRRALERSNEGVPLLGSIPGVRWLFSNHATRATNTETIVLITPFIINDDDHEIGARQISGAQKKREMLEAQAKRTQVYLQGMQGRQAPLTTEPLPQTEIPREVPKPQSKVSTPKPKSVKRGNISAVIARPLATVPISPVRVQTTPVVAETRPLEYWSDDDIL